jgi:hypothetical protein
MNIKTTIVLLVLLLGVGTYVLFTRDRTDTTPKHVVHTLVDVKPDDVTRFVITSSDGKKIAAQKTTEGNAPPVWKITEPVTATAESYKISSLLDSITSVKSTAEVPATGSDAPATGLDKPQYTVELFKGNLDTKLTVGDTLGVSGGVYVRVDDHPTVDVVSSSLTDALEKPASDLRKTQLFDTASPSVQQIAITHRDGSQLVLEKQPKGWEIIKPITAPADSSAVDDLVSSVINMTPSEFEDAPNVAMGLAHPADTVTFSADAPSTQPTTHPAEMPGGVKVIFGGYDDLEKKNVFAQIPDGTVVKVPATVLDSLNKKPYELRDKTLVDIDPTTVTRLTIALDQPATTQPVAAAVNKTVVLQRRKKEVTMGPVLPTTGPTSKPAAPPQTDWFIADKKPVDADDAKVSAVLNQLHPLKVDKYLESPSTAKVVKTYTVTVSTTSAGLTTVLVLRDPGNDGTVIGSYNDVWFEMPRTILADLGAEFAKAPAVK